MSDWARPVDSVLSVASPPPWARTNSRLLSPPPPRAVTTPRSRRPPSTRPVMGIGNEAQVGGNSLPSPVTSPEGPTLSETEADPQPVRVTVPVPTPFLNCTEKRITSESKCKAPVYVPSGSGPVVAGAGAPPPRESASVQGPLLARMVLPSKRPDNGVSLELRPPMLPRTTVTSSGPLTETLTLVVSPLADDVLGAYQVPLPFDRRVSRSSVKGGWRPLLRQSKVPLARARRLCRTSMPLPQPTAP